MNTIIPSPKKPFLKIVSDEEDEEAEEAEMQNSSIKKTPLLSIDHEFFNYFRLYHDIRFKSMLLENLFMNVYTSLQSDGIIEFAANANNESECTLLEAFSRQHTPISDNYTSNFTLPKSRVVLCDVYIIKEYTLINKDEGIITYIQQYLIVLREICLQIYAKYLNENRHLTELERGQNLVVIPEIYKITKLENTISIYMEKIDNIKIKPTRLNFIKFDTIIKSVFNWFELNNLFHNDTAHRNVYFTSFYKNKNKKLLKLAIIDFGEAYLRVPGFSSVVQAKETGYYKNQDLKHFFAWLNGRYPEEFLFDEAQQSGMYGGNKTIKRRSKMFKRRSKMVKRR